MSTLNLLAYCLLAVPVLMTWLWFGADGGFRPLAALSMTLGLGLELSILAAKEADGLGHGSISVSAAWTLSHENLVTAVALLLIGSALWDRFHRKNQEQPADQSDDTPELEAGPDDKGNTNA